MIKQSLWAEFLIGGSIYFISFIIIILIFSGKYDLSFFNDIKDYWPVLSIISILFSYIFGFIAHRFIYIIVSLIKNKKDLTKESTIILYQYGSEGLIEHINYQYRLIVTSRLLMLGMFVLGIVLGIWIYNSVYNYLTCPIAFIFIVLCIILYIITIKQKKDYKVLLMNAANEIKKSRI